MNLLPAAAAGAAALRLHSSQMSKGARFEMLFVRLAGTSFADPVVSETLPAASLTL